jgi:peptidoglycan/xylan/chitin deacetylase (PgdA/CDA1 family)
MRFVSPILKSVVYPALQQARCLRPRGREGQLSIVTYHGVKPAGYISGDRALDGGLVTAESFRAQLQLLKKRYHVISPEHFRLWLHGQESLPPWSVLLTCDDGLRNNLTDMLPILQEEGLRCIFFVTGSSASETRSMLWYEELYLLFREAEPGRFEAGCGDVSIQYEFGPSEQRRSLWWNAVKQLSAAGTKSRECVLQTARVRLGGKRAPEFERHHDAACCRFEVMTLAELRELDSAGMTIGAHTQTHSMLSLMPEESAFGEISENKIALESVLGKSVWGIAYPFGTPESITREILEMPHRTGFEAAFMNVGGGFGRELPIYAMPRVHVPAEMNMAEFEAHVSGFHERVQRFAGRGARFLAA